MQDLKGRVAIVTGGGRGLGEAICRSLGAAGATIAVADLRQELADTVAMSLGGQGGPALAVQLYVGDEASADRVVRQVSDKHGKLDILVNNAGTDVTLP